MSDNKDRLKWLVVSSSPTNLQLLTNYLTDSANEHLDTARRIAQEALNTPTNKARVTHYRSMAQALFTVVEHIQKEQGS